MDDLLKRAKHLQEELVEYRRQLHSIAEVGFQTEKTQRFIFEKLKEFGYYPKDLGKGGVVATLGNGETLLRADIDGLPMREETGVSYACKIGNMHACGHDMHAAMLLGAAKLLKGENNVRFLFQPAEEILQGGKESIRQGVLQGVKKCMALHVMTAVDLPSGKVLVPSGVGAPSADFFKLIIKGKSCHGSTPQNGVDGLAIACQIYSALQGLITRELPPTSTSLLTIGKMQGGVVANAISDRVEIEGTLRSFEEAERSFIKKRIEEIAKHIAKAFRGSASLKITSGCPVLINDQRLANTFLKKGKEILGADNVCSIVEIGDDTLKKSGGSEDFAYFSQEVPCIMLALAAGERKKGYVYPLHHPSTQFDESVLWLGSFLYSLFATEE